MAALVAGLLALIGGYLGAWAARRTDYEKWLRQERSQAFGMFLQKLHEAFALSIDLLNDPKLESIEADSAVTERFFSLEPHENIVRLYLLEQDRDSFSTLVHRIWAVQNRSASKELRMKETRHCMDAIQKMFERRLHG